MCGILYLKYSIPIQKIKEMFNQQKHRGPDNTKIIKIKNQYFCHHRLAIINPENTEGNQPIIRKDIVLICNGEIYNYKKIISKYLDNMEVNVDCDVIIELYKLFGIKKTLHIIDGDFAFVLYDIEKDLIFTSRDPVGLKPLFIGYKDNKIISFSSEIKSINMICDKIIQHPIGCYMKNNKFYSYFNYVDKTPELYQKYDKMGDNKVRDLLVKSVKKRILHTDKPYAILCSGGIDSSLILSIAKEILHKKNIHVFSIELDGSRSMDSFYATMLTDLYDVKHTIVKFTWEEGVNKMKEVIKNIESYDVNTIRASIPMYLLAEYISNNTNYKVILSGEGADELFMGYSYFRYYNEMDGDLVNKESLRLIKNLHSFDVLRAERCFSSHGLELRVPFLDKNFIKYVLNLGGNKKILINKVEKHLLRVSFSHLKIPERILYRQKERFSDGIGFDWVPKLINYSKEKYEEKPDYNMFSYYSTPTTKEEFLYRYIFEQYYPNQANIILKRVMPKKIEKIVNKANNSSMIN